MTSMTSRASTRSSLRSRRCSDRPGPVAQNRPRNHEDRLATRYEQRSIHRIAAECRRWLQADTDASILLNPLFTAVFRWSFSLPRCGWACSLPPRRTSVALCGPTCSKLESWPAQPVLLRRRRA